MCRSSERAPGMVRQRRRWAEQAGGGYGPWAMSAMRC